MQGKLAQVLSDIDAVLLGKQHAVKLSLACLLAGGHLLLEDLPGMGKTTLSKALAKALNLSFNRVQFTADLFPSDLLGVSVYRREEDRFQFVRGPVFCHILLADEINRTPPKTQSALLEAMAEGQVSVDGESHILPEPFFVIATQNPQFQSGTYPLPESQLDRFTMCLSLGYPSPETERALLLGNAEDALQSMPQRLSGEQMLAIKTEVAGLHVSPALVDYLQRLLQASRDSEHFEHGLSPRAGMSVLACARAWAYLNDRDHVTPDDIQAVFIPVCSHRLQGDSPQWVAQRLEAIVAATPVV